jgi:four helix bundle protein
MHQFKDLKVWQKAMDIAETTYQLCASFPDSERYGLISQMRRAAVSIPSNIAEGAGRNSKGEFRQFLGIAAGSSCELETQFLLAGRFSFLTSQQLHEALTQLTELQKMIHGLRSSLRE